jgi:hypothetical protein
MTWHHPPSAHHHSTSNLPQIDSHTSKPMGRFKAAGVNKRKRATSNVARHCGKQTRTDPRTHHIPLPLPTSPTHHHRPPDANAKERQDTGNPGPHKSQVQSQHQRNASANGRAAPTSHPPSTTSSPHHCQPTDQRRRGRGSEGMGLGMLLKAGEAGHSVNDTGEHPYPLPAPIGPPGKRQRRRPCPHPLYTRNGLYPNVQCRRFDCHQRPATGEPHNHAPPFIIDFMVIYF